MTRTLTRIRLILSETFDDTALYNSEFRKAMISLLELAYEQGEGEVIREIEKALKTADGDNEKAMILLRKEFGL